MSTSTIDNCIFCRIAQKKIDVKIIDENENAIAFLDAFPLTAGHTLVITKNHYAKLQDVKFDQINQLFSLANKILPSIEKGTGVQSTLIAIHNGKDAGQEIPHLHVHIVPRKLGDGGGSIHSMFDSSHRLEESEMIKVFKNIKEQLESGH
ncbi:MAG TPA: HIT family protein [Nitrososphaeraceae archaeon]|nr:HIT family protein [Nitrososphaeraceae archaeon]